MTDDPIVVRSLNAMRMMYVVTNELAPGTFCMRLLITAAVMLHHKMNTSVIRSPVANYHHSDQL